MADTSEMKPTYPGYEWRQLANSGMSFGACAVVIEGAELS